MKQRQPSTRAASRLTRVALTVVAALGIGITAPATPAAAWDPSTTHLSMVERSVLDSAMHVRWMDQTGLSRGLFSAVRLDPDRLPPGTRRALHAALSRVHAASGAEPLGGPGTCPGPSAPVATRARCVEGDLWETTALGWIELGVIVETTPAERLLHHFVDRDDPAAPEWTDGDLSRTLLRRKHAKVGATLAERLNGTAFEGTGRSAVAWLQDTDDRWAPPALARHLRAASHAADRAEREHHLAMALLCTGALLHVLQDLSVPAYARGDLSATFLPLSETPGDRGLPLQELARTTYGRSGLPKPVELLPRTPAATAAPLAPTLAAHVLGGGQYPGLVHVAGRMNFSESSLPPAWAVDDELDAAAAAAAVLDAAGDRLALDPAERAGARFDPWPQSRGYLYGGSGRPLAAFEIDDEHQLRLWLDRRVYRAQMQELIPAAVTAGRSALDLVFAAWPSTELDAASRTVTLTPGATWAAGTLTVMVEDKDGRRTPHARAELTGEGAHRVTDAWPATLPEGSQVVLVLENPADVMPPVAEHWLDLDDPADVGATPSVPRPRAKPPTTTEATRPAGTRATPPAAAAGDGDVSEPSDDSATASDADTADAEPDDAGEDAEADAADDEEQPDVASDDAEPSS